jgi:hypothetical protein
LPGIAGKIHENFRIASLQAKIELRTYQIQSRTADFAVTAFGMNQNEISPPSF